LSADCQDALPLHCPHIKQYNMCDAKMGPSTSLTAAQSICKKSCGTCTTTTCTTTTATTTTRAAGGSSTGSSSVPASSGACADKEDHCSRVAALHLCDTPIDDDNTIGTAVCPLSCGLCTPSSTDAGSGSSRAVKPKAGASAAAASSCEDKEDHCAAVASLHLCSVTLGSDDVTIGSAVCPKSCNTCPGAGKPVAAATRSHQAAAAAEEGSESGCKDLERHCARVAALHLCETSLGESTIGQAVCPKSCGVCGQASSSDEGSNVTEEEEQEAEEQQEEEASSRSSSHGSMSDVVEEATREAAEADSQGGCMDRAEHCAKLASWHLCNAAAGNNGETIGSAVCPKSCGLCTSGSGAAHHSTQHTPHTTQEHAQQEGQGTSGASSRSASRSGSSRAPTATGSTGTSSAEPCEDLDGHCGSIKQWDLCDADVGVAGKTLGSTVCKKSCGYCGKEGAAAADKPSNTTTTTGTSNTTKPVAKEQEEAEEEAAEEKLSPPPPRKAQSPPPPRKAQSPPPPRKANGGSRAAGGATGKSKSSSGGG
jgi:hypothetical protein